jgi:hypothetical protein
MANIEPLKSRSAIGQLPSVLPWLGILFAGSAALGAWLLIGPALGAGPYYKVGWHRTVYEYSTQIVLLFIPWALALWAWRRGARASVRLLIGGAVLLHLLVLFAPLAQSQDFYQYLFYGKMQAVHGANPFVVNPNTFWADPWFPWIRWNTQPSVYGPAWILLSFSVAKVVGGHLTLAFATLKLVILALDVGIMAMIVALGRGKADPQGTAGWGLLAFAWNPLVLITVPLAGSADVAVVAAFLGAILSRRRGRNGLATVLLTLAALVKVYAVVGLVLHLVLLARERGGRRVAPHAAASAGLAALAYAPYWAGLSTFRGLIEASKITNLGLAGTLQRTILGFVFQRAGIPHWDTAASVTVRVLGGAVLLAASVWAVRHCRDEQRLWWGTLVALTAYVLATPWFFYWYLLGPLALVAVLPTNRLTYPILTFSATSLIAVSLPWPPALSLLQAALRYGLPVAVFALQRYGREPVEADRPRSKVLPLPVPTGGVVPRATPAAK